MYRIVNLFFILVMFNASLRAQISPKEGVVLSYRIIGFSFDAPVTGGKYKLQIAQGSYAIEDSFASHVFKTVSFTGGRVVTEVPLWGCKYTWRVVGAAGQAKAPDHELHRFSVGTIREVDSSKIRFRILQEAKKYKDAYVFLDNNKALYDMKGNAVWFLPDTVAGKFYPADMKPTPQGSITMLINATAYDIKYNGDVLLRKDAVDSEHYHHEFTRLSNGNYMALGSEPSSWRPRTARSKDNTENADTAKPLSGPGTQKHTPIQFGTASELDPKGNLIWHWSSANYFLESGLNEDRYKQPMFFLTDTHPNALYFDEQKKMLYMGLRNTNCILKVKYPEGRVVNAYQQGLFSPRQQGLSLFCGQHSLCVSKTGDLYVFDNNTCDTSAPSKLLAVQESAPGKNKLTKLWEYPFTYDGNRSHKSNRCGNAVELPDLSMLVCMGMPYSKIFIVNRQKQVLWSAVPEKWNLDKKEWVVIPQYRASIILNRKELEKMIWK